ncbi:Mur ligase family protein [Alkalibaculum bacchi]|uniref:Mur ligase family protein n=1 Tax=Alkalibaculum bacchi TaxID=645887 RepID=UPI0026EACD47|nr:Mur ligase family protein [Alkalibaculum bacchi]
MKTIGMIGTHGKTSILYILEHILFYGKRNVASLGDLGLRMNKNKLPNDIAWMEAIEEMKKNDVEFLLVEIHDNTMFFDMAFDCVILSAMDKSKNKDVLEGYKRLICNAKSVLLNADSKGSLELIKGISNLYVITYGLNSKSTVTASTIYVSEGRIEYNYYLQRGILSAGSKEVMIQEMPIVCNLLGYQNIYNTIAVITTALLFDINIEESVKALTCIEPIQNRLELRKYKDMTFVFDMAKDNRSIKMLFETFQYIYYEHLHIVISMENLEGILSGALEEFLEDFSYIRNANMYAVGKRKKILDNKKKDILADALVKNHIDFKYYSDVKQFIGKDALRNGEDSLIVCIGFHHRLF